MDGDGNQTKGSWHCSKDPVSSYDTEIIYQELLKSGEGTGTVTYAPKDTYNQFVAGINAKIEIPEIKLIDGAPEGTTIRLRKNYQDEIITTVKFLDTTHDIHIGHDGPSLKFHRNFCDSAYIPPIVEDSSSKLVKSRRIVLPLSFPFSNSNDSSYPLIYGDSNKCSAFTVEIEICSIHNLINMFDGNGVCVPVDTSIIYDYDALKIAVTLRADLRREEAAAALVHRSDAVVPRSIHMSEIKYHKETPVKSGQTINIDFKDMKGKLLGIFWAIERTDSLDTYCDNEDDPLVKCSLKCVGANTTIIDKAYPEELMYYPGKVSNPYIRKGMYCIPLSVKLNRKRAVHPLNGTKNKELALNVEIVKGNSNYLIRTYMLVHTTLDISRNEDKFLFKLE